MDYQALARLLPISPRHWTLEHVTQWLQFVHLPRLTSSFQTHHIHGHTLTTLNQPQLQQLGVHNNIIKRKLLRWIKEGLPQFERHLQSIQFNNKENIPPLQRQATKDNQIQKLKTQQPWIHNQQEEGMVVRSCDGSLAAFYVMKDSMLKIGRASANAVRSLEVSVAEEHAQLFKRRGAYFLMDKETESGTFVKITHPHSLNIGTLIQLGTFLMQVLAIYPEKNTIVIQITHMQSEGVCEVNIQLSDGCNFYSFGRRKTNNFYAQDQHLSGIHAKIFFKQGQFVIQDMHSTNGTWLRLNKPFRTSQPYELQQGSIFKIGTTITYQCLMPQVKTQKMDIEYEDSCSSCRNQQRNMLFLPCKHNVVCAFCAQPLLSCPLCGLLIEERLKIYT